jgi:hypothetical protein
MLPVRVRVKGADTQGLGRSRGGLSAKIHTAGDALGNPVRLIGSPGQRNDVAFAHDLVDSFDAGATLADRVMTLTIFAKPSCGAAPKS